MMPLSPSSEECIQSIESVIEKTNGDSDLFARTLKLNHIPHISFSQITSIEFCPYQYYLQYIQLLDPKPVPLYFEKGKLLHKIIASSYGRASRHEQVSIHEYFDLVDMHFTGEHNLHLKNAIRIHLANIWENYELIAVEQPFVMSIDPELPPCVGVIDLILKQDDRLIIVDHKTGRDFYHPDRLQMAIYKDYVEKHYGVEECAFYYDHYRWVIDLTRIRKPAIQRSEIPIDPGVWGEELQRIKRGYRKIDKILSTKSAVKHGECFRCPYRSVC
jgi:CRISPR/Cas system-associated exonuclease Cas4 (RecB family)